MLQPGTPQGMAAIAISSGWQHCPHAQEKAWVTQIILQDRAAGCAAKFQYVVYLVNKPKGFLLI